jgi:hypothetical protein
MATFNSIRIHEMRRVEMLKKLDDADPRGFQLEDAHPHWFKPVLLSLNTDRLAYPVVVPGMAGFVWHISKEGKARLQAVTR